MKYLSIILSLSCIIFSSFASGSALKATSNLRAKVKSGCQSTSVCPAGSYLNQCENCSTDSNGILYCSCPQGEITVSSILQNSFACSGNIGVRGGVLVCNFVSGNYGLSCKECQMTGFDALQCSCQNTAGEFLSTTLLNANTCTSAENDNGNLVCMSRTAAPTSTQSPTSSQCIWSSQTVNGELAPTEACSVRTALQGCEYNNFCCWNYQSNTCQPVPGCPNCLALTSASACGSAPSSCCSFNLNTQLCQRVCPENQVNTDMCPGNLT